jgi:dihydropteridine reductase
MKSTLVLGGNGALGKALVTQMKTAGWRVASIDLKANEQADSNIIVHPTEHMQD